MTLIAFIVALYGIASLCEGMEILFDAIHAVMSPYKAFESSAEGQTSVSISRVLLDF